MPWYPTLCESSCSTLTESLFKLRLRYVSTGHVAALDSAWKVSSRQLGLVLFAVGTLLIIVAWTKSYPVSLRSQSSFLFGAIYPSFWIGLSISNAALFLLARGARSSWQRLACAFTFLILSFSITYFFTFLEGPDSNTFRGLTENVVANGGLSTKGYFYFEWPLLFILGAIVSEVLGTSVNLGSFILFSTWTILLASGLFFYTETKGDIRDFMAVVAYGISTYAFLVWQYSPQTFTLSLLIVSLCVVLKNDLPHNIATMLFFVAIVFAHPFLAVFLILAMFITAIKDRKQVFPAVLFALLYGLNLVFQGVFLVHQIQLVLAVELFGQYSTVAFTTLGGPASYLDALAQGVSRSITLSMWAVLGMMTLLALLSRKLRSLDVSVGVSGLIYAAVGAFISILGERAIQIVFFPTTHALRAVSLNARQQKALSVYFLLAVIVFPIGLIHIFYNDTNYLTLEEQHAASVVYLPLSQTNVGLVRGVVAGYLNSKSARWLDYTSEYGAHGTLSSASQFNYVMMNPEFERALQKAGLSNNELSDLERSTIHLSRVYSNGYVTVFMGSTPS
jgi:hypothetical protein